MTVQRWNRKDLERRLCHALHVARRAVEQLGVTGYRDDSQADGTIRPEKVICETAILLLAAVHTDGGSELQERTADLAMRIAPHARSSRMRLGMCLQPALALDYAVAHLCLVRLGYPDPAFDALLRKALESSAHKGKDRVPNRVLEQEWVRRMGVHARSVHAEGGSSVPGTSAVRESLLTHPMDLLGGTQDDFYAFTHALMYQRDFDLEPLPLPRGKAVILAEADAALARCLDDEDYDLAGELLLSWPLIGSQWSPAAAFAFRVLAHVEDRAGFLPSGSTNVDRLESLEGEERKKYLFATAYHTVYVMGLLCAASLRPGKAPPVAIPLRASVPGSADRVLAYWDEIDRVPGWWKEFQLLSEVERDALAGLLLHVALRRKHARRDFAGMADLIRTADELGLADSPLVSQSAELLERLAVFAHSATVQPASASNDAAADAHPLPPLHNGHAAVFLAS